MLWAAEGRGTKSKDGQACALGGPHRVAQAHSGVLRVLLQLQATHRAEDPAWNYVQFIGQFLCGPGFLVSPLAGIINWLEREKAGLSDILCCCELGARRLCSEMLLETLERG